MSKTIFIVAGFKHKASEVQYNWMRDYFKSKGYIVKIPDIEWNKKVMTDYVNYFTDYYNQNKSETNFVLGFSYGAMIAFISAEELNPDKLILCSLSPYFNEDLESLKKSWKKLIGHRRVDDFKNYSSKEITTKIASDTTVIYGSSEGKKYPRLKHRCIEVSDTISKCKLLIAEDAPHEIDYPSYVSTIKSVFE